MYFNRSNLALDGGKKTHLKQRKDLIYLKSHSSNATVSLLGLDHI